MFFFQLRVKKNDNMRDVLHNIINFHVDRLFLDAVVGWLLINHELLTSIASNENFMKENIAYLSLNASCSPLQESYKYYVI